MTYQENLNIIDEKLYQAKDPFNKNYLNQLKVDFTKNDAQISLAAVNNFFDDPVVDVGDSTASPNVNDLSPFK